MSENARSVELDDGKTRWHGLTDDEWLDLWAHWDWQRRIARCLDEIMRGPDSTTEDRLGALTLLNDSIRAELLPPDPELPERVCRLLLAVTQGVFDVPWWRRIGLARRQRKISERLTAARFTLLTISQFYVRREAESRENQRAELVS